MEGHNLVEHRLFAYMNRHQDPCPSCINLPLVGDPAENKIPSVPFVSGQRSAHILVCSPWQVPDHSDMFK